MGGRFGYREVHIAGAVGCGIAHEDCASSEEVSEYPLGPDDVSDAYRRECTICGEPLLRDDADGEPTVQHTGQQGGSDG